MFEAYMYYVFQIIFLAVSQGLFSFKARLALLLFNPVLCTITFFHVKSHRTIFTEP